MLKTQQDKEEKKEARKLRLGLILKKTQLNCTKASSYPSYCQATSVAESILAAVLAGSPAQATCVQALNSCCIQSINFMWVTGI